MFISCSFRALVDFVKHLKAHDYKDGAPMYRFDASASVILKRHNRLVEKKVKLLMQSDVNETISRKKAKNLVSHGKTKPPSSPVIQ